MYLSKVDVRLRLYTGLHLYDIDENIAHCVNFCESVSDVLVRISSELSTEFERRGQAGDYSSLRLDGEEIDEYLTSYAQAVAANDRIKTFVADLAPLEKEELPQSFAADFEALLDATRSSISTVNALVNHLDAIVVHEKSSLTVREHPLDAYNQAKEEVPQLIQDTIRHFETFRESFESLMPKLDYDYQQAVELAVKGIKDPLTEGNIEDIATDIKSRRYIEPTTSHQPTLEQADTDGREEAGSVDEDEREATNEDPDPIKKIGKAVGLSSITINSARDLFTRVQRHDLRRGPADETVYCAVLYIACRQDGTPRTPTDFEAETGIDTQTILDTVGTIKDVLNVVLAPAHPLPFVERYVSEFELHPETEALAESVVNELDKRGQLGGRRAASIAAAVLYAVAQQMDEQITQQTVADVSGVSVVTIREQYQDYLDIANNLNTEMS